MELDTYFVKQVEEGKVILFLGAGASYDAKDADGNTPPMGNALRDMLSEEFLGGKYKDSPLNHVSELAITQSDLFTVQEFIRNKFEGFLPTDAHKLMCSFRWHAIVTTNYDLVIERAYEGNSKAAQKPRPFIKDGDRVEDKLKEQNSVALLKIHGCITQTTDERCPLILTIDQFADYKRGRERVFSMLTDWGIERPILFVGYGLSDPNIRAVLADIDRINPSRPRGYSVSPNMDDVHIRHLESKKISGLKGTFADLMYSLDSVASKFRGVASVTARPDLPIFEQFSRNVDLHPLTLTFIESDAVYVKEAQSSSPLNAVDFYKGMSRDWSAIEQDLDVRRSLSEQILEEVLLAEEVNHLEKMEVVLISAYAGAGKTILLQRLAWEAARTYNCFCLYLNAEGILNIAAIKEIIQNSGKRLFLFVDNLADRVRELQSLAKNIGNEGKKLTIIGAERINEWNFVSEDIASLVTTRYNLSYLNDREIDDLIALLSKHKALGNLTNSSDTERREAFRELASRQLLVALHEATFGKRFEDIIKDEFDNIQPHKARQIYNTVCTLNRLQVPVRAGVISRLHGVRFEDFEKNFFSPLEHVVTARYDHMIRDNVYEARHPHIAEIVFSFLNQEDKYGSFIACLDCLNIDYDSDRKSLRQMIRAKHLLELFPNHELGSRILDKSRAIVGSHGPEYVHFLHQSAIYEMKRSNGSLKRASELIAEGIHLFPDDLTLKHSMANLYVEMSERSSRTEFQSESYLNESIKLGRLIASSQKNDSHGYHIQAKAWIKRFKRILDSPESESNYSLEETMKEVEKVLANGLQQFPNDSFLRMSESDFAELLQESQRSFAALEAAFVKNTRSPYVALRLSDHYKSGNDLDKAQQVLKTALDSNRSEKRLHFAYGLLLMERGESSGTELVYHFKRSFTQGDRFYEAQLLYGRQLYINGDKQESRKVFKHLENQNLGHELRTELKYLLSNRFSGRIRSLLIGYAWIQKDGTSDTVFLSKSNVDPEMWSQLSVNMRITFDIGFTMRGASACEVKIE